MLFAAEGCAYMKVTELGAVYPMGGACRWVPSAET